MSWQDSFIPDAQTVPQVVQAQGWQSSFVPDGQQPPSDANYQGSILPFSNDAEGNTHFDINAGLSGSIIKGAKDLMNPESYPSTSGTESGGKLSPEAISDLMGISSLTMSGKTSLPTSEASAPAQNSGAPPPSAPLITPTSGDIELIKKKLDMAGITPQQYADALTNSSPDDFAGELGGDPLRMQTQAQAKITGDAMQPARDAMRERLATAPQRVQQIIEKTFYPSSGAEATGGGDAALMKGAASPSFEPVQQMQGNLSDIEAKLPELYKAADSAAVPRKPFLDIINTPNGQTAMKDVVEKLANQNITPESAGIVVDPQTGFHGLQTNVPVSTVSELSKSLGDLVNRNPMTGAIEDSSSSVAEGQRQHITSYLSENSPEFAKANANAAANFQGQSAFEAGRKLAHSAAGENADALMDRASETYSPQELAYHKAGYAQGLADAIQKTPLGGGNPASQIAKGTVQNTTSNILSPTQGQQFADLLMQEKNRIDLAQRGLGGSNTAETLSAGVPEIPTSAHGLIAGAANKVMDFVNAGKNERIAQLLYATSPEQKAILARKIVQ